MLFSSRLFPLFCFPPPPLTALLLDSFSLILLFELSPMRFWCAIEISRARDQSETEENPSIRHRDTRVTTFFFSLVAVGKRQWLSRKCLPVFFGLEDFFVNGFYQRIFWFQFECGEVFYCFFLVIPDEYSFDDRAVDFGECLFNEYMRVNCR